MALPTRGTVATLSANGSAHNLSVTVPASGSLLIYVQFRRSTTEDVTAISRDGQTPSLFATEGTFNGTGWATRVYYLTSANAGTADLSVTLSAGRNTRIIAIPYSGVDTGGTPWGTPTRETDLSTAYGASVTADQELVAVAGAYYATANAQTFTATGTGQTELDDNRINDQYAAASYQNETGTVTASWTFTATPDQASNWLVTVNGAASGASAAVTGTLASGTKTQANIVSGDDGLGNPISLILTLTGDTWVASGATFDAQRQAIINGLDAASSPATGWNTLVRDALAVTAVVRTSDTIVTVTIPATAAYVIAADEVITCTIPASALTGAVEVIASPTVTIHFGVRLSAYSGTTNASGVKTTDLTSDQASVRVLTTAYVNGTVVARTTTRPT